MKKLMLSIVLLMSGASLFSAAGPSPQRISTALQRILNTSEIVNDQAVQRIVRRIQTAKLVADEGDAARAIHLINEALQLPGIRMTYHVTVDGKRFEANIQHLLWLARAGNDPYSIYLSYK